jgi:hypothetical protein
MGFWRVALTTVLGTALMAAELIAIGVAMADDSTLGRYFAPDGRLSAAVELRDGQSGVVGVTGTLWTINPDGTFQVARFINQSVGQPERTGQLTPPVLQSLAESLASQDFAGLPMAICEEPLVNAHTVELRFGDQTVTCTLQPGKPLTSLAAGAADSPEARFGRMAEEIRQAVGS